SLSPDAYATPAEDGKVRALVLPFLIGVAIATWATISELTILLILFDELILSSDISLATGRAFQLLTLTLIGLTLVYVWAKQTEAIMGTSKERKLEWRGAQRPSGAHENPIHLP